MTNTSVANGKNSYRNVLLDTWAHKNTIESIMNGKAISQAIMARFLIDDTLMLSEAMGVPVPNKVLWVTGMVE